LSVVAALILLDSNLYLAEILLGREPDWGIELQQSWVAYVASVLYLLLWGGLLAALHLHAQSEKPRATPALRIATMAAAVGIALVAIRMALSLVSPESFTIREPGLAYYAVRIVPGLLLFLPLSLLALLVARNARPDVVSPQRVASTEWAACGRGLRIYANALTWKIAVVATTSLALLVAAFGEYRGLGRFLLWAPPLIMLAVSVRMVVGLRRASEQPYDSPAKTPATLAYVLALLAALLELYMTYLSFRVQSGADNGNLRYGAMRDMQERIVQLSKYSTYLGLVAVAALVLSLRSLFLHWGQQALARRTLVTALGIATTLIVVVLLRREAMAHGQHAMQKIIAYASLGITIAFATALSLRALALSASRMIGATPKLAGDIVHKGDHNTPAA
jgi:hypothetical protein